MKEDILLDQFQFTVADFLVRNKSILDGITKFQDSCSSVNRAIVKTITQCGCCRITAHKQEIKENSSFEELKSSLKTHLDGNLCDNCRDAIEKEFGQALFYIASLCNTLELNMYDIMLKEMERVKLLGNYTLR